MASDLIRRCQDVRIFEPENGWSLSNLVAEAGAGAVGDFLEVFPYLRSEQYLLEALDLEHELAFADLVLVHEWNDPELVRRVGVWRAHHPGARLLFHDTHHRSVTDPGAMGRYDLSNYDGVLAYGNAIRQIYLAQGWVKRAWTWHEAADVRIFRPLRDRSPMAEEQSDYPLDLVWIGNWGDGERSADLREFLIEPVKALQLRARVFGVRYPADAVEELAAAGIEYGGWVSNYRVPEVFAQAAVTVHIPRRPYGSALPGIPTIRLFEAMACGIPLISAPWDDCEGLFNAGLDYLVARDGREMQHQLRRVLTDRKLAARLTHHGLKAIQRRHTCAHRVDQLFHIYRELTTETVAVSNGRN
jgi:spore maturation protein CgeB